MSTSNFEQENVRSIYNFDISELQKKIINDDLHDRFHYIYTALVLDNKDPDKQGKIKAKVINLFDNLTASDIPWCLPVQSNITGSFAIPEIGDYVSVFFSNGDVYAPYYIGKTLNTSQIPSQLNNSYPDTIIFYQTKTGNYSTLNRTTGEYKIVSQTGSKITMKASGEVEVDALIISFPHTAAATVTPDPTGGPFCAIPFCPLTGLPHQGTKVINT